jgi:hypothetical protein
VRSKTFQDLVSSLSLLPSTLQELGSSPAWGRGVTPPPMTPARGVSREVLPQAGNSASRGTRSPVQSVPVSLTALFGELSMGSLSGLRLGKVIPFLGVVMEERSER